MKMRHPAWRGVMGCAALLGCEPRVVIGADDGGARPDAVAADLASAPDVVAVDVVAPQRDVTSDVALAPDVVTALDVVAMRDAVTAPDVVATRDAVTAPDVVAVRDVVTAPDVVAMRDVVTVPDADGTPCAPRGQCPSGYVCEFAPGCGETTGVCRNAGCLLLPVAPQYCGCDGVTVQRTNGCLPDRPWRARGPCFDGGVAADVPAAVDAPADAPPRVDAQVPADLGPYRGVFCGNTECDGRTHFCQLTVPPGICFPFGERCQATPTCECIRVAFCNGFLPVCGDRPGAGITAGCTGIPGP